MSDLKRTVFYERHKLLGANIVDFCGWEMPIFYPSGIVNEHLATRKKVGLFDVSHMGRFIIRGNGGLRFLQHVLSNNAEALKCYTKAIELQPNDGRGFYSRGRINMAEERFYEGVDDFTKAINLYQRRDWKADAFYNRARCYEGAGRIEEAIADYNEAFNNGIQQAIQESFRLKDIHGID